MKKIVALSVLLVLLSAAVFADDGSGWKIGFTAQLARDFVYSTKASGEYESTRTVSNQTPPSTTSTGKLGEFTKGSSNLFTWTEEHPWDQGRPDNRLIISLSNSGDNYKVYIDAKVDDTWVNGVSFIDLFCGDAADWEFSGNTGASGAPVVFDGKVGTGRYGGFVPVYEFWDDWLQSSGHNFFGVYTMNGFRPSDNISATAFDGNPWQAVYALGATFGGNFRFALGSTLGSFYSGPHNEYASASAVEAGFMLSGKGLGPLSFDVFYAVKGKDGNTVARGTGAWDNLFGIYAGLDIVKDLGLSVGYTANFLKNETATDGLDTSGKKTYETVNPTWSGIDIKVKFSGINKIGITFNNNISFASAAREDVDRKAGDDVIIALGGGTLARGYTQNWFAYDVILGVNIGLTDRLGVTFGLGNNLGVTSSEYEYKTGTGTGLVTYTGNSTNTADEFRTTIHAEYSVGNVTFGLGLVLVSKSSKVEYETKSVTSTATPVTTTVNYTGNLNVVSFSVPLFFKVSI